jgi:hypothetical protein
MIFSTWGGFSFSSRLAAESFDEIRMRNPLSLKKSWITYNYLTLCTFSFEINESRLSDTRCCITTLVIKECTRRSLPNYLVMTSYHWNVRENTVTWHRWMNDKITWRHARNVVFLRILYKFYFNPCYLLKIRFHWNVR